MNDHDRVSPYNVNSMSSLQSRRSFFAFFSQTEASARRREVRVTREGQEREKKWKKVSFSRSSPRAGLALRARPSAFLRSPVKRKKLRLFCSLEPMSREEKGKLLIGAKYSDV